MRFSPSKPTVSAAMWKMRLFQPERRPDRSYACFFALIAAGCASPLPATAQSKQLNLLAWADYVDPKILTEFTAATGIAVIYETYDSNETAVKRLLPRPSDHDVVILASPVLAQAIKAGRLKSFSAEQSTSFRNLWPEVADRLKAYDPTGRYGVTYSWGTIGLGVNPKKLQERLGPSIAVNSWDLVLKPDIAAKLKDCGIALPDTPDDILAIALTQTGSKPDSREVRDQQKAIDALIRVRPSIRSFHGSGHINGLATGELCVAVGSSLDVMQARKRAGEVKNGVEIRYVVPREGAPLWFDALAITADSTRADAADQFVSFLSQPAIAARTADFLLAAPGTKAALDQIQRETRELAGLFPDETAFRKLYAAVPPEGQARQTLLRQWQRVRTGK
jgi:putrescine transport system substrate-binding protein